MGDPDPDLELLERLVGDVPAFAAEHWGRRPLLRSSGEDFTRVIDVDRIEAMLLSGSRQPTFRLVRDGTPLPPGRSTMAVRLGGRPLDDVADVDRIAAEVADGATLVMQGLQRTDVQVAKLCRSLERATSHPVQANAYLSPRAAAGLAEHADDHDVLVLQVVGSKRWEVQHLGTVRTEPGDVLYLPAGVRHAASTQDATSLHLTVGLVRVTHGDVLRRALGVAAGEELRRPLPLGYARPEHLGTLADALQGTLATAMSALADLPARSVAEDEQRRAGRRRRALAVGQLRSVLALDDIGPKTWVHRRADAPATVDLERSGDRDDVVVTLTDRRLRLPAAMGAAVDVLLSGKAVEVGGLPGLDDGSRLVLVRRLVREGLLVVEPPTAPPGPAGPVGPTASDTGGHG